MALYIAWHSYVTFAFASLFFFPVITSVVVGGVLLSVWFVLQLLASLQRLLLVNLFTPLFGGMALLAWLGGFVVALVALAFSYFWASPVYFWVNFAVAMLMLHHNATNAMALCAQAVAALAVTDYNIISVVYVGLNLGLVLVVVAFTACAGLCIGGYKRCRGRGAEE